MSVAVVGQQERHSYTDSLIGTEDTTVGYAPAIARYAATTFANMDPRISIITLGVEDLERSLLFYRDGLGFPTTRKSDGGIIFFQTSGVCLALYPYASTLWEVLNCAHNWY